MSAQDGSGASEDPSLPRAPVPRARRRARRLRRARRRRGGAVVGAFGILVGMALFFVAITWAALEAVRMRTKGQPWFGSASTAGEVNRLLGWWYLDEAAGASAETPPSFAHGSRWRSP